MTVDNLDALLRGFQKRNKGILVDSNLLLLFLVGLALPDTFTTFKPIANQGFVEEDFERLCNITSRFKILATTPHILAEVSNHSDKLKGENYHNFCHLVRSRVHSWQERFKESAKLCKQDAFISLGLTDAAIEEAASGNFLVLTVDADLAVHLKKRKVDVINYNHIRVI